MMRPDRYRRPARSRDQNRGRALAELARSIRDPRERAQAWSVAADAFLEEGSKRGAADALIRGAEARAIHSCRWGRYCPILTLKKAALIALLDDRIVRGQNASALAMLSKLTHRPRGVPHTDSLIDFFHLLQAAVARLGAQV